MPKEDLLISMNKASIHSNVNLRPEQHCRHCPIRSIVSIVATLGSEETPLDVTS